MGAQSEGDEARLLGMQLEHQHRRMPIQLCCSAHLI